MSKILVAKFENDILSNEQIDVYKEFKERLENEGLVEDVSGEFSEAEDILEVSDHFNQETILNAIDEMADELNISYEIVETAEYDIKRAIDKYGIPNIYAFGGQVQLNPSEDDDVNAFYEFLEEYNIGLNDITVSGEYGDKMKWGLPNGLGIADVRWE